MLKMKSKLLICFLLLGAFCVRAQEHDRLLQLLKQELRYTLCELQKQEHAPYHMSFRVSEIYTLNVTSSFGAVSNYSEVKGRTLTPQIRLGSPALDNFKYSSQGAPTRGQQMSQGVLLPLGDESTDAIREAIWRETLQRYKYACDLYDKTKAQATVSVEDEDKAPCFSESPVSSYYEAPLPADRCRVDVEAWKKRLDEISAIFKTMPELQTGSATLTFCTERNYFVNTEGASVVQNRVSARVMLSAQVKAADGMDLPLNKDYFAYDPADLPDNATIMADARDMLARLRALQKAPVADPFTGPAILSGPASGVFFHEIFGHRLEGHRLKTGGQTFKKMVGEQVLPEEFAVYCDPTLKSYAGTDLNGHYLYDNEGVKARRVDNVTGGILQEFLMSRVPLDGFPSSNGHGRTSNGGDPVSRQSNLIIETSHPYTDAELRAMLTTEARRQGKDYGYYIRTVTSGFTFTGEGGSLNSFNVTPLEVYRVYVDGRPDELVRGVDLIGTPLSMFSNIVAGGDRPSVFTGQCGAESGWVPVTACSPTIYVSQIETQRRAQSRDIPPILPAPETGKAAQGNADAIIFAAMKDEQQRNLHALTLPGEAKPYYLSYTLGRYRRFQVMASLGGVTNSLLLPWSLSGGTQLFLGDYQHNSDIQYMGQIAPVGLPQEADYDNIRRGLWQSSDQMYRYSLNTLAQKTNYLKQNPLPEAEAAVPDMQELPAATHITGRTQPYEIDMSAIENLAARLSAIFKEYKDIFNSSVVINGTDMDIYRLTTEGQQLKSPQGNVNVIVSAEIRTDDGMTLRDSYSFSAETPAGLPSEEELAKNLRSFADGLLRLKSSPLVEEYYTGPVLFEEGAVFSVFERTLLGAGGLIAMRSLAPNPGTLDQMLGRKIADPRITIKNYTALTEYAGQPLWGHYETDAYGVVPPKEMTLVDKGIFKNMLNGRIPTLKSPVTTGSDRFMAEPSSLVSQPNFGTVHISVEKGTSPDKLKKELLKAAKAEGLAYAYIIRRVGRGNSLVYRVNVKDGQETQMRVMQLNLPDLTKLGSLKGLSSGERVRNYMFNNTPVSAIYPSGIIVGDVEINRPTPKTEKAPAIPAPLQRGSR